jgi:hypothetical protein
MLRFLVKIHVIFFLSACSHEVFYVHEPLGFVKHTRHGLSQCEWYYGDAQCIRLEQTK